MNLKRLHYLKNILYREPSFVWRYYFHQGKMGDDSPEYIYMADGKMLHGGLFDRLKGAVSIFAISKIRRKKFGIYFMEPFQLERYLRPNLYDWRIKMEDIIYSFHISRPVIAYSEFKNPRRLFKNRRGQTHFYFGYNILDYINNQYNTTYKWESLYNELFSPTEYLNTYIDSIKGQIGSDYMTIHLRFLNLLGDKVEVNKCKELNEGEKEDLLDSCIEKVGELISAHPQWRPMVSSDSMIFLNEVRNKYPNIYIAPGHVKHIDATIDTSEDENLKLFSDVYLMAGAQKVFSVIGKGLYPSAFPEYSAKIGNRPFERIKISAGV